MPAPTVRCKICQKDVTKRSTVAVGNGDRACREHSEAQSAASELAQAEKNRVAEEKRKRDRKQERIATDRRRHEEHAPLRPRCWICEEEGLRQDEWFTRWLIEMQKYELVHGLPANPFNMEEMQDALSALKGIRCLYWVKWAGDNKKIRLRYRSFELVQMAEQMMSGEAIMLVCGQCCQEKGFSKMMDERAAEITLDDMMKHAAVYEVVAKPVVEAIAKTELEERN